MNRKTIVKSNAFRRDTLNHSVIHNRNAMGKCDKANDARENGFDNVISENPCGYIGTVPELGNIASLSIDQRRYEQRSSV